jgi:hypothetical protein
LENVLLESDASATVDGKAIVLAVDLGVLDGDGTVARYVEAISVVTTIVVTVGCELRLMFGRRG